MFLDKKDLGILISILSKEIESGGDDPGYLNKLKGKLESLEKFEFSFYIRDEFKVMIERMMKRVDEIAKEYANIPGVEYIEKYDSLRKECVALLGMMSDAKARLTSTIDTAEKSLNIIKAQIASTMVDDKGKAVAVTKADRDCIIDERYKIALEEYTKYKVFASRVATKWRVLDVLCDSLKQSISTAKSSYANNNQWDNT